MVADMDLYLFDRLKENDQKAFEMLFRKHYVAVYNFARYYIDDPETCHDIVQDFFGNIWEMRESISITGSVKSYFFTSVRNACLNYLKKQNTKRRVVSELFDDRHDSNNGYDVIFGNELKEKMDAIMQTLPAQCREIFYLSRVRGLRHKEIAEKLEISPKTVETQIYRALKIFKKNLIG